VAAPLQSPAGAAAPAPAAPETEPRVASLCGAPHQRRRRLRLWKRQLQQLVRRPREGQRTKVAVGARSDTANGSVPCGVAARSRAPTAVTAAVAAAATASARVASPPGATHKPRRRCRQRQRQQQRLVRRGRPAPRLKSGDDPGCGRGNSSGSCCVAAPRHTQAAAAVSAPAPQNAASSAAWPPGRDHQRRRRHRQRQRQ